MQGYQHSTALGVGLPALPTHLGEDTVGLVVGLQDVLGAHLLSLAQRARVPVGGHAHLQPASSAALSAPLMQATPSGFTRRLKLEPERSNELLTQQHWAA